MTGLESENSEILHLESWNFVQKQGWKCNFFSKIWKCGAHKRCIYDKLVCWGAPTGLIKGVMTVAHPRTTFQCKCPTHQVGSKPREQLNTINRIDFISGLTPPYLPETCHHQFLYVVTVLWLDSDWMVTILLSTSGTCGRLQSCVSVPWSLHSDFVLIGV